MAESSSGERVDLCIVTARSSDFQTVCTVLESVAGRVTGGPFDYFKGESRAYKLAFCAHRLEWHGFFENSIHDPLRIMLVSPTGEGMENTAALVSNIAQTTLCPSIFAMVGACSARQRDVNLGDLLVPFKITTHSGKKLGGGQIVADANIVELDNDFKKIIPPLAKAGDISWLEIVPPALKYSLSPLDLQHHILLMVRDSAEIALASIVGEISNAYPSEFAAHSSNLVEDAVEILQGEGLISSAETFLSLTSEGAQYLERRSRLKRPKGSLCPAVCTGTVLSGNIDDEEVNFEGLERDLGQASLTGYDKEGFALFHSVRNSFTSSRAIFVNGVADFGTKRTMMAYYRNYCTASATAFLCSLLKGRDFLFGISVHSSESISTIKQVLVNESEGENFLSSDRELRQISTELHCRWPSLMRRLHMNESNIQALEHNYRGEVTKQSYRALLEWRNSLTVDYEGAAQILKRQFEELGISILPVERLQYSANFESILEQYENDRLAVQRRQGRYFLQPLKATVSWNVGSRLTDLITALDVSERDADRARSDNDEAVEVAAKVITIWVERRKADSQVNEVFKRVLRDAHLEEWCFRSHYETPRLLDDYLSFVCKETESVSCLNVQGVSGPSKLKLDSIFVALRLDDSFQSGPFFSGTQVQREVEDTLEQVVPKRQWSDLSSDQCDLVVKRLLDEQSSTQTDSQKDKAATSVFRERSRLVILGDPGTGKTTIARWLALSHARALEKSKGLDEKRVFVSKLQADIDDTFTKDGDDIDMGQARLPVFFRAAKFAEFLQAKKKANEPIAPNRELADFLGCERMSEKSERLPDGRLLFGKHLNSCIMRHVAAGNAVIIIDGLDEISSSSFGTDTFRNLREDILRIRQDVNDCISEFMDRHVLPKSGNQIVITSRISGYSRFHVPFSNVTHALVRPMTQHAIRYFCHRWMRAAFGLPSDFPPCLNCFRESNEHFHIGVSGCRRLSRSDESSSDESSSDVEAERDEAEAACEEEKNPRASEPEIESEEALSAATAADALVKNLFSNSHLYAMASNPLLITILAMMFKSNFDRDYSSREEESEGRQYLPLSRGKLFIEATSCLIREDWRKGRSSADTKFENDGETTGFRNVLLDVADSILGNSLPGGYIGREELRRVIARHFPPSSWVNKVDHLINQFDEDPGLFVQKSTDSYGFIHQSFLEFFAGVRRMTLPEKTEDSSAALDEMVRFIMTHSWEPKWKEPILHGLAYAGVRWPLDNFNCFISKIVREAVSDLSSDSFQIVFYIITALSEWDAENVDEVVLCQITNAVFVFFCSKLQPVPEGMSSQVKLAFSKILHFNKSVCLKEFQRFLKEDCKRTRCFTAVLLDQLQIIDEDLEKQLRSSLSYDLEELGWPIHSALRRLASCETVHSAFDVPKSREVKQVLFLLQSSPLASIFAKEISVLENIRKTNLRSLTKELLKIGSEFRSSWKKITDLQYRTKDITLATLNESTFRCALDGNHFVKDVLTKLRFGEIKSDLFKTFNSLSDEGPLSSEARQRHRRQSPTLLLTQKRAIALFRAIFESHVSPLRRIRKQVDLSVLRQIYVTYVDHTFSEWITSKSVMLTDMLRREITESIAAVESIFTLGSKVHRSLDTLGFPTLRGIVINWCLVRSLVIARGVEVLTCNGDDHSIAEKKVNFFRLYLDMDEDAARCAVNTSSKRSDMLKLWLSAVVDRCLSKDRDVLDIEESKLLEEEAELVTRFKEQLDIDHDVEEQVDLLDQLKTKYDEGSRALNRSCTSFAQSSLLALLPKRIGFSRCSFEDWISLTGSALLEETYALTTENPVLFGMVVSLYGGIESYRTNEVIEQLEYFRFQDRLSHTQLQQCLEVTLLTEPFPQSVLKSSLIEFSGCTDILLQELKFLREVKPIFRPDCLFRSDSGVRRAIQQLMHVPSSKLDIELKKLVQVFLMELQTSSNLDKKGDLAVCLIAAGYDGSVFSNVFYSENHHLRSAVVNRLSERLCSMRDPVCRAQVHLMRLPGFKSVLQSSCGVYFAVQFVQLFVDMGGKPDLDFLQHLQNDENSDRLRLLVRTLTLGWHLSSLQDVFMPDKHDFLPELRAPPTEETKIFVCSVLDYLALSPTFNWWARSKPVVANSFRRLNSREIFTTDSLENLLNIDVLRTLLAIASRLPIFADSFIQYIQPIDESGLCALLWRAMNFAVQTAINPRSDNLKMENERESLYQNCERFFDDYLFSSCQVLLMLIDCFPSEFSVKVESRICDGAKRLVEHFPVKAFQLLWWYMSLLPASKSVLDLAEFSAKSIGCSLTKAAALARLSLYCCSAQRFLLLDDSLSSLAAGVRPVTDAAYMCASEIWVIISSSGSARQKEKFWCIVAENCGKSDFGSLMLNSWALQKAGKHFSEPVLFDLVILASRTRDILISGECCTYLSGSEEKLWLALVSRSGSDVKAAENKIRKLTARGYLDLTVPVALVLGSILKSEDRKAILGFIPYLRIVSAEARRIIASWLDDESIFTVSITGFSDITVEDIVHLLLAEESGLSEKTIESIFRLLVCENDICRARAEDVINNDGRVYCTASVSRIFLQSVVLKFQNARLTFPSRKAFHVQKILQSIHHNSVTVFTEVLDGVSHRTLIENMYSASPEVWNALLGALSEAISAKAKPEKGLVLCLFLALCSLGHGFRLQNFSTTCNFYEHALAAVSLLERSQVFGELSCYFSSPLAVLRLACRYHFQERKLKPKDLKSHLAVDLRSLFEKVSKRAAAVEFYYTEPELLCLRNNAYRVLYSQTNPSKNWLEEKIRNHLEQISSLKWRDWELSEESVDALEGELEVESFPPKIASRLNELCFAFLNEWDKEARNRSSNTETTGLLSDVIICLSVVLGKSSLGSRQWTLKKTDFLKFVDLLCSFVTNRSPILQYSAVCIFGYLRTENLGAKAFGLCADLLQNPGSSHSRSQIIEKVRYLVGVVEPNVVTTLQGRLKSGSAIRIATACCLVSMIARFSRIKSKNLDTLVKEIKGVIERPSANQPVYPFWIETKTNSCCYVRSIAAQALAAISGTLFESSYAVPLRLGVPDAHGIFVHREVSKTPIWYKYGRLRELWLWTPYDPYKNKKDCFWMPVSTDVVKKGGYASYRPSVENRDLISYLNKNRPSPGSKPDTERFF